MAFSSDGAKMFVAGGSSTDYVHEYALTAPFDVSTATHTANVSVSTQDNQPEGVAFSSDGAKMFIAGDQHNRVYEYALGTPFDVTSYSFTASFDVSEQVLALVGVAFSNDGARMFVVGSNRASVYEYALTAPFDVSTASPVDSFDVSGQDNTPTGMAFSSDGAKMFIAGDQHNRVYEYALGTPFDVTSYSFTASFDVPEPVLAPAL
jgi:sugar lactone lactonase YvrE